MIFSVFSDTGVDTTDLLILLIGAAYLINQVVESKGWSKSSKRLREENTDLSRRNDELVETVKRHEQEINAMKVTAAERLGAIEALKTKVIELERQSQQRVLEQLEQVEEKASARHAEMLGVLQTIAMNTTPSASTVTVNNG